MYSDNPLYAYVNMDTHSKYVFKPSLDTQFFETKEIDISEVIGKVQNTDYLAAAYRLNQLTDIGMFESFLYICQMKKNINF